MTVTITHEVAASIMAHAQATYPYECVGLLLGSFDGEAKHVVDVYPVENRWSAEVGLTNAEDQHSLRDRFYLDPRDYLKGDRAARSAGLDIVGCYHSHPDDRARPSERDRVGAQGVGGGPYFSFLIQSVSLGIASDLTSWLLAEDGTHFSAEPLQIIDSQKSRGR